MAGKRGRTSMHNYTEADDASGGRAAAPHEGKSSTASNFRTGAKNMTKPGTQTVPGAPGGNLLAGGGKFHPNAVKPGG